MIPKQLHLYRTTALLAAACLFGLMPLEAQAQQRRNEPKKPTTISMATKDGVELKGTYYPSTAGKAATPVVLLADWKDSRSVFDQLAKRMQNPQEEDKHQSFAVITVDLRGHGDSTNQQAPTGQTRSLDAARLGRRDFEAMVRFDMEAVRRFIVEKNDAGELNINRLSIVGAGLGASVAVNWAAVDWSAPPLAVGKQGQDVKALVLISPEWSYRGLQLTNALRHPGVRQNIAFLIMYGGRERSVSADVRRIEKQLERYHPRPGSLQEGEPHTLSVLEAQTGLQGTKFLTQGGAAAEEKIINFLTVHVAAKDLPWSERSHL